jgi:uncharacterized protein GlcG (DUF336 family)
MKNANNKTSLGVMLAQTCALLLLPMLLCSCGGGGDSGSGTTVPSATAAPSTTDFLTVEDVQRIVAQGVGEATARKQPATIAVVDRVGNVLAVFRMTGAASTFKITSKQSNSDTNNNGATRIDGGLENIDILPDTFAAITKAITGAYLSSNGNAFSSRTAGHIVQENFNPREANQPAGPLYGVQFSQLSCSDLMRRAEHGSIGPKRSPLGLAGDPGGLPLYKNNRLVGGVGIISDGIYGLDADISDIDQSNDELIAVAASTGYAAPDDIRGNRISVDGRTLRYVDSESLLGSGANNTIFANLAGASVVVGGYFDGVIRAGTAFGSAASGYFADTTVFAAQNGFILLDSDGKNRYPVLAGSDGFLKANEVSTIAQEALKIANRARAQIRRPLGSAAQVTITVVDTQGNALVLVRTPDAPVFGTDVALQKARTAVTFSHPSFAAELAALPSFNYLGANGATVAPFRSFNEYVASTRTFFNDPTMLANGLAFSSRALGNVSRPFFPDGIQSTEAGPFSTPYKNWSPFHLGLQLDLNYNAIVAAATGSTKFDCTGLTRAKNGIQIFAGAVPIYRNNQLVGAIGISGDGIDQDDMVAFLGLANAGKVLANGIGNAPKAVRADTLAPRGEGTRLRYVNCPIAPFNDSAEQNVCEGI